ncbi:MAG: hypothetical protein HY808_01405 [Nitrospirae bacterium]|nr:hypothetical protein [Nitrospirota bacterium]
MRHSFKLRVAIINNIRNIFVNLFLIIISCVLLFAVLEWSFRLFNPQLIIPRYVETSSYGIRKHLNNVNGEIITPEFSHKIATNSQGFRGKKEYSITKDSDVYRIIVLGDSVTFGYGVEDKETFSAILEKKLSLVKKVEVINMGVSGFGTAEELIKLRKEGFNYNPDLVILGYFPNDHFNNIISNLFKVENGKLIRNAEVFAPALFIRDRLNKVPGYTFLSQHSHFVNFLRNRISYSIIRTIGKAHKIDSYVPVKEKITAKENELTAMLLNEFIQEGYKHNISVIILDIPEMINKKQSYSNLPTELLLLNNKTFLVDVQKQIFESYPLLEINYKVDKHLRPLGHELIGDWLSAFVKERIWAEKL